MNYLGIEPRLGEQEWNSWIRKEGMLIVFRDNSFACY
jgi:hypothetical protein